MDFRKNVLTAIALIVVIGAIALAEQEGAPKAAANKDAQARNNTEVFRQRQKQLDVAKLSYLKLKFAVEGNPGSISDEVLSKTSLQVLQLESLVARTREEGIKAASEYLEREGLPVKK